MDDPGSSSGSIFGSNPDTLESQGTLDAQARAMANPTNTKDGMFVGKILNLPKNIGVTDGARTRDHRSHSPVLYQLSYSHH